MNQISDGGSMKNDVKKVLVATDFSAYANRTQYAAGSLCAQSDSRLTLLYVLETSTFLSPENRLTPGLLPELVKVASINLRKQASLLSRIYGIPVDTRVVCGNPAQEILKCVETDHADMIIAAIDEKRPGKSPQKTIARRIAARTSCPVLTLDYTKIPSGTASVIKTKIRLYERTTTDKKLSSGRNAFSRK